jgi:uncharacterized protein YbaA (DUF1428 family)
MSYVESFVLAVHKDKLDAYKEMARAVGPVFKEHGALAVVECIGVDVPDGEFTSFPRAVRAMEDEVVVLSWIVYASRADRDAVNDKVIEDPRLAQALADVPFDRKRMFDGCFESFLEL